MKPGTLALITYTLLVIALDASILAAGGTAALPDVALSLLILAGVARYAHRATATED